MRRQFSEQFARICVEFNKVFPRSCSAAGGEPLELDGRRGYSRGGNSDYLPSLPEKKPQNMMQLSGGRKGINRHCPALCHPELKAVPVLSF